MADAERIEGAGEEGAEFVPEVLQAPRSDVFTLLLILAFVAFLVGIFIVGRELYECYDVQFFIFKK